MGRLDIPDPHRDEDDLEQPRLPAAWKEASDRGIAGQLADRVIEREQGEIPPRLLLQLRGFRTQAPRRSAR